MQLDRLISAIVAGVFLLAVLTSDEADTGFLRTSQPFLIVLRSLLGKTAKVSVQPKAMPLGRTGFRRGGDVGDSAHFGVLFQRYVLMRAGRREGIALDVRPDIHWRHRRELSVRQQRIIPAQSSGSTSGVDFRTRRYPQDRTTSSEAISTPA